MSSSSSQKTTRPNSGAMTHSTTSFKSINSNCTNKDMLLKDDVIANDNKNKDYHCSDIQAGDEQLCHNAQSNLIIPKIHIEFVSLCR